MPKIEPVCKDCKERKPGCHDTCGRYLAAKDEYYAKKKALSKAKADDGVYMDYLMSAKDSMRKRK